MGEETPEPPKTDVKIKVKAEVEGEDLSSTEKRFSKLESKFEELEKVRAELEAERTKISEQSLDLRVKETMTLFEGVENKADIEEHVTTIAKCGGEDALTATKAILKSVMESKVIVDASLTPSGGEEISDIDKLSIADFGGPIDDVVGEMIKTHKINTEG
jgi:hypothetical protein